MFAYLNTLIDVLSSQPGSLAYHLGITAILVSGFYPAYSSYLKDKSVQSKRLSLGFGMMIGIRLAMFAISGLVTQLYPSFSALIAPFDRTVNLFTLIIIIWMWTQAEPSRRIDFGGAAAAIITLIAGAATSVYWINTANPLNFNGSNLSLAWGILATLVLLGGELILLSKPSKDRSTALIMLGIIFFGQLAQLIYNDSTGDIEGLIRLANISAFPLLLGLNWRLIPTPEKIYIRSHVQQADPLMSETKESGSADLDVEDEEDVPSPLNLPPQVLPVKGIDVKLFQTTMAMASVTNPEELYHLFTMYCAFAVIADICLLVTPPTQEGEIDLLSGHDLISEENLGKVTFSHEIIPGFIESIAAGEFLHISAEDGHLTREFANKLYLESAGNFLSVPIINLDNNPIAVLILISPYTKNIFGDEDVKYLESSLPYMAAALMRVLSPPQEKIETLNELSQAQAMEPFRNEDIEATIASNMDLMAENASLRQQLIDSQSQEDLLAGQLQEASSQELPFNESANHDLDALILDFEATKDTILKLENEKNDLKVKLEEALEITASTALGATVVSASQISENGRDNEQELELVKLHEDLERALTKITSLQSDLASSSQNLTDIELAHENELLLSSQKVYQLEQENQNIIDSHQEPESSSLSTEQAEVISSIAQDLRQPMSSISGYTDLLLSESVGIIGALQRKFLDRVKASTDRLNSLIDDLLQIAALESGGVEINPEVVDLNDIFDESIHTTSSQFREKSINLRVDLPVELPRMETDRDAVQQIIIHLLQNAGAASPRDGDIFLQANRQTEDGSDFVLISITDSGEGIPDDDIARVFSRLYRADNPLIQGVGDTGVGLSISKTLAEALGGKIWVTSQPGDGSTFSVLLPCMIEQSLVDGGD